MPSSQAMPAACGEGGVRGDADADEDEIDGEFGAVREAGGFDVAVAEEAVEAGAFADVDAVGAVEGAEPVGGDGGGDALEDAGGGFHEGDVEAALGGHGGGLEPDVAAADDQDAAAFGELVRHGVDVGERADGVDAVEVPADGGGEAAGGGAGGEGEVVVRDDLAACGDGLARRCRWLSARVFRRRSMRWSV